MCCAAPLQSCLCLEVVRSKCSKQTGSVLGRSKTDVIPDQWACIWNCSLGLGFPGGWVGVCCSLGLGFPGVCVCVCVCACVRVCVCACVHFQMSILTRVTPGSGEARLFFLLLHLRAPQAKLGFSPGVWFNKVCRRVGLSN